VDSDEFYHYIASDEINGDNLYHYTTLSNAVRYIVPTNTLRFNALKNMDDPFEKYSLVGSYMGIDNIDIRTHPRNSEKLNNLRMNTCIGSFTTDKPPTQQTFSCYRGYAKSRMWIQYADKGNGACLVFSRTLLQEEVKKQVPNKDRFFCGEITYDDRIFQNTLSIFGQGIARDLDVEKYFAENKDTLLLMKNKDFQDEQEYRLCITPGAECDYRNFSYGNSLIGVIIGYEANTALPCVLTRSFDRLNIPFGFLGWIQGSPQFFHPRVVL
jgi:hypothetical protein